MPHATSNERRRPFQFRLWQLMSWTTIVAMVLGTHHLMGRAIDRFGLGVVGISVFLLAETTVIILGTAIAVSRVQQQLATRLVRGVIAGSCLTGLLFGWIPVLAGFGMGDIRPLAALVPIVACGAVLGSIVGLIGRGLFPIIGVASTAPVRPTVSTRLTDRTQHPALKRATDRVMCALVEAKRCAIEHRHAVITPDHLLWALGHTDSGVARLVLNRFGADIGQATDRLAAWIAATPPDAGFGPPLLSRELERLLDSALKEADAMADHYLGTEHLILGLLGHPDFHAARILQRQGVTWEAFRAKLVSVMTGK